MKRKVANCPACGGLVEFQLSTALVTVCGYCHSVLAREGSRPPPPAARSSWRLGPVRYWMTNAVTMPNIPFSDSAWERI